MERKRHDQSRGRHRRIERHEEKYHHSLAVVLTVDVENRDDDEISEDESGCSITDQATQCKIEITKRKPVHVQLRHVGTRSQLSVRVSQATVHPLPYVSAKRSRME